VGLEEKQIPPDIGRAGGTADSLLIKGARGAFLIREVRGLAFERKADSPRIAVIYAKE